MIKKNFEFFFDIPCKPYIDLPLPPPTEKIFKVDYDLNWKLYIALQNVKHLIGLQIIQLHNHS